MIGVAILALGVLLPFGYARHDRIEFNQYLIEDWWADAGAFTSSETVDRWQRNWRAGVANIFAGNRDALEAKTTFDDPDSIFRFVLAHCPPVAVVYPTETYYYWKFALRDRIIAGNFRFVDADAGVLHMGYFDVHDRRDSRAKSFTVENGVTVTMTGRSVEITADGRTASFHLGQRALDVPPTLQLLESEEAITGVLDESGVPLVLLYNNEIDGFYYVLNESIPLIEPLAPLEGAGGEYVIGERSRFVYVRDAQYRRFLLVGVAARNIYDNNYYDGPFDQVPPRLAIKEKLEKAYPYVVYRGGIDEHGNFLELDHQRVAISPYQDYATTRSLMTKFSEEKAEEDTPSQRYLRLTYESKREYHKRLGPHGDAPLFVAQGWPANHEGESSRAWDAAHDYVRSSMWPPNHLVDPSATLVDPAMGSLQNPFTEISQ